MRIVTTIASRQREIEREQRRDERDPVTRSGATMSAGEAESNSGSANGASVASRRERLRRPLPNPPSSLADSNRGSNGHTAAAAAAGVRGVVASRLAAMASAGSTASSSASSAATTNGASDLPTHKLTTSYSVDSNSRIPSYRLSSLDRLAQRQRLFEATTATGVQPNGLPSAHPSPPTTTSTSSTTTPLANNPTTTTTPTTTTSTSTSTPTTTINNSTPPYAAADTAHHGVSHSTTIHFVSLIIYFSIRFVFPFLSLSLFSFTLLILTFLARPFHSAVSYVSTFGHWRRRHAILNLWLVVVVLLVVSTALAAHRGAVTHSPMTGIADAPLIDLFTFQFLSVSCDTL